VRLYNCEKWLLVLSCQYVRPHANNLDLAGRTFMKFGIRVFFENVIKIQVSLKFAKNNGFFTWRPMYIWYLAEFTLEWGMFQTKVADKITIQFHVQHIYIYFKSCRLWGNVEKISYSRTCHRRQYGACPLHTGFLRLKTHTQNV